LKKAVWLGIAAVVVLAIALNVIDPDSAPDADVQEKALAKCLHAAGLTVKSEIPPFSRYHRSPEYDVEVREDARLIGLIYLFDASGDAASFVERARLRAEDDDEKPTVRQRGPAAVDLVSGASAAPAVRGCVDKAVKPPSD
jgi:hypothetical protein